MNPNNEEDEHNPFNFAHLGNAINVVDQKVTLPPEANTEMVKVEVNLVNYKDQLDVATDEKKRRSSIKKSKRKSSMRNSRVDELNNPLGEHSPIKVYKLDEKQEASVSCSSDNDIENRNPFEQLKDNVEKNIYLNDKDSSRRGSVARVQASQVIRLSHLDEDEKLKVLQE